MQAQTRIQIGNEIWLTEQAALDEYPLEKLILEKLISAKVIRAMAHSTSRLLAEKDMQVVAPKLDRAQWQDLGRSSINLTDAAQKYQMSAGTLRSLARKGYVTIVEDRGWQVLVNEGDVAFAAALAKIIRLSPGKSLFPRNYRPPSSGHTSSS